MTAAPPSTAATPVFADPAAARKKIFERLGPLPGCRALQSKQEIEASCRAVEELGFPPHHDPVKNWDLLNCFHHVLDLRDPLGPVLDIGSSKSVILQWLEMVGYEDLYACDLKSKKKAHKETKVRFSRQDCTKTVYPDGFFQAITSVSVIEHGVPFDDYLKEMSRLLRPGGVLATTTDYWSEPIDCRGIFPYPDLPEMKIFQPHEIEEYCGVGARYGLTPTGRFDPKTAEKTIYWERVDRRYTAAFIALKKSA
jgi:SAM-dependent methyltransferase